MVGALMTHLGQPPPEEATPAGMPGAPPPDAKAVAQAPDQMHSAMRKLLDLAEANQRQANPAAA